MKRILSSIGKFIENGFLPERKYFVSYHFVNNKGISGHGRAEIITNFIVSKMKHVEYMESLLLARHKDFESLVILNYKELI